MCYIIGVFFSFLFQGDLSNDSTMNDNFQNKIVDLNRSSIRVKQLLVWFEERLYYMLLMKLYVTMVI